MKRILPVLSALYITAMMAVSAGALSYDIDAPVMAGDAHVAIPDRCVREVARPRH